MGNPFKKFRKSKKNNVNEELLPQFMQDEMQKARLGVLYIFSKAEVDGKFGSLFFKGIMDTAGSYTGGLGKIEGVSELKITSTVIGGAKTPLNELVKLGEGGKGAKSNIQSTTEQKKTEDSLWKWLWDKFTGFFKMLWTKLTRDVPADMKNWGSAIKSILKVIVSSVVSAAVPLTGIFDVVSGTTKACAAGFQRLMSWVEERTTALVKGHPTVIVKGIQKAMNRSIGEGLYTAVKGGIQIGADVALAGAGALAKAIATALELLFQVVQRIVEITVFEAFSNQAKIHWQARETSGFTKEPDAFAAWLGKYVDRVPAIAALAMNCGYCGGPMHYLAMFTGKDEIIGQKDFDAGVAMLTRHKKFGADYLRDIGLSFHSGDPVVNGALKAAKSYGQINHIKQNSVGNVVYGVLTG